MSGSEHITDEKLVAFLDGALPEPEATALGARIEADPQLQARLTDLSIDLGALREGFDALLEEAPTVPVQKSGRRTWQTQLAAAAAIFALGLGAGWVSTQPQNSGWEQAVADYQVLYAPETLATAPLSAEARQVGLAAASEAIGLDLTEEVLRVDGMTFQRAQILRHEGDPLIQVAYLTEDGVPVAFCFLPSQSRTAPNDQVLSGLPATTWSGDGYAFIVIGPTDPGIIRAAANQLGQRLPG